MKYEYLVEHHGLKADSCVDGTVFTEKEAWDMFESGDVTYDEADHMSDGMSLIEARAILASYICDCDICGL